MARRGRCHRQRRLRRWSFSALKNLPVSAYKNWLLFLFKGFPTLFQKDYEKDDMKKTEDEQVKSKAERFAAYKSICLFGLGSLFWGSAAGVLGKLEEENKKGKHPTTWMDYSFLYSVFAIVLMLLGVTASSFPDCSLLAASIAGLGSLQAIIFVLGAFHVGSLKYHPYEDECKYSMIGTSILITIYWGISVQDPMILHFLVKLIAWLASWMVYVLFMGASKFWQFGKRAWTEVRTKVCALKTTLMTGNTANNYQSLPHVVAPVLM